MMNKKKRAKEIAQENINSFTARQNIRKKNAIDEDLYLKNYMQDVMRKESKIKISSIKEQKRREIDTRDFNKNLAINRHISTEQIQDKIKASYSNEQPAHSSALKHSEVQGDPFAEEGAILFLPLSNCF